MTKINKILVSIVLFIAIVLLNNKVQATNISISPETPKVGDTVTISVVVPNVHTTSVTANVSGAGTYGTIKVIGGDLGGVAKDYSNSAQFTCTQEGELTVEISSDSNAVLNGQYVNVSATKKVTVAKKEEPPTQPVTPEQPTTPEPPVAPTKSSEARLSNFGIKPIKYDFTGFRANTYEYTHEVPNSVSEVEIYANKYVDKNKVEANQTINGTGKVSLKEGKNIFQVVVTAEDGSQKTYTLNITRRTKEEEQNRSEARLGNLGINPKEYDFTGFRRDTYEYKVEVPSELEEIEIYANTVSQKAKIEGTGKVSLQVGDNNYEITVTAEDGTKKTYKLNVIRKQEETKAPSEGEGETPSDNEITEKKGLTKLDIAGFILTPRFNSKTYEYTLEIEENVTSLNINAVPFKDDANVEIVGNENLKFGENTITIIVTDNETEEKTTYQITVNIKVKENSTVGKTSWFKPSTWGKEEKIILLSILVLIVIIVLAVILKIRISREEDDDDDDFDLPGGEELDRAIAEHQELEENDGFEEDIAQNFEEDYKQNFENDEEDLEQSTEEDENIEEDNKYKEKDTFVSSGNMIEDIYTSRLNNKKESNTQDETEEEDEAQMFYEEYAKNKGKHEM